MAMEACKLEIRRVHRQPDCLLRHAVSQTKTELRFQFTRLDEIVGVSFDARRESSAGCAGFYPVPG